MGRKRGEPRQKLSPEQIAYARSLKGTMLQVEAARLMGVSQAWISHIWKQHKEDHDAKEPTADPTATECIPERRAR